MHSFSLKLFGLVLGTALFMGNSVCAANANSTDFDDKAAVIFAYFAIGNDDNPSTSLRNEQFNAQIEEIVQGDYTVKPLTDIIDAFYSGKSLPERTIALTFDGADKSVLQYAVPLLEKYELPYTVFIPAGGIDSGKTPFLSWDELRTMKKSGLVGFGIQPASYGRLSDDDAETIKRQINGSLSSVRKELDISPTLFSYPFGEYSAAYKKIVKDMGFKAAFAQQSGVVHAGEDRFALPRFTLTERYGDMDRFIMTADALPLPVGDISPADPHLQTLTPAIGFTVADSLSKSLKSLSCFSSGDKKLTLEILNARVELRLSAPIDESRVRINCTLPVSVKPGDEPRVRWYGMMVTVPEKLIGAPDTTKSSSADSTDYLTTE